MKLRRGFTLIEVLVTVVIIGIVSAVGVTSFSSVQSRQRLNLTTENIISRLQQQYDSARSSLAIHGVQLTNEATELVFFTCEDTDTGECEPTTNREKYVLPEGFVLNLSEGVSGPINILWRPPYGDLEASTEVRPIIFHIQGEAESKKTVAIYLPSGLITLHEE